MEGESLVRDILGKGLFIKDVAALRGLCGERELELSREPFSGMLGEPESGIWVWLIAPLLLSYGLAPVPRRYLRRRRLYLGGSIESGSSSVLSPEQKDTTASAAAPIS